MEQEGRPANETVTHKRPRRPFLYKFALTQVDSSANDLSQHGNGVIFRDKSKCLSVKFSCNGKLKLKLVGRKGITESAKRLLTVKKKNLQFADYGCRHC